MTILKLSVYFSISCQVSNNIVHINYTVKHTHIWHDLLHKIYYLIGLYIIYYIYYLMVINLQFKDKKQSPANNFKTKGKNERENGVIFYV